jgi:hypothetical protein
MEDILQSIFYGFFVLLFLSFWLSALFDGRKSRAYHWKPGNLPNAVNVIILIISIVIGIILYYIQ